MMSAETMEEDGNSIAAMPMLWFIIVNNQSVAVIQVNDVFNRRVSRPISGKQECSQSLEVPKRQSRGWTEFWKVNV